MYIYIYFIVYILSILFPQLYLFGENLSKLVCPLSGHDDFTRIHSVTASQQLVKQQ